MADTPLAWSRGQRILHWTIAALIILTAPMGVWMVRLSFRQLLLKFLLYQIHKTVGILIFLFVLAQLILHARRGRPPVATDLPSWQRHAALTVHGALFVLLIAVPLLGYLTAAAAPARIPTLFLGVIPVPNVIGTNARWYAVLSWTHLVGAASLLVLAGGHAAMALKHHLSGRDTLRRMWRGVPG